MTYRQPHVEEPSPKARKMSWLEKITLRLKRRLAVYRGGVFRQRFYRCQRCCGPVKRGTAADIVYGIFPTHMCKRREDYLYESVPEGYTTPSVLADAEKTLGRKPTLPEIEGFILAKIRYYSTMSDEDALAVDDYWRNIVVNEDIGPLLQKAHGEKS